MIWKIFFGGQNELNVIRGLSKDYSKKDSK